MIIEGIVEEIIFRNETNGYTVGRLNTSDGEVTIVGYAAFLKTEEMVQVDGDWIYHNKFGEQFNFTNIKTLVPSTLKGIENYLSAGLIPNIGPKTAKKIVEKFGLESLDVIQYTPEKLKEIPGIGDKKLRKIVEAYDEQRELRDIMVYLQQFEITVNYGTKIYKKYGKDTIKIISENPYRLSEDIFGIGFKTADKIANKMGIENSSPYRLEAGLKFVIMQCAGEGHSYVPKEEFFNKSKHLLGIDEAYLEEALRNLALKNTIYIINDEEEIKVYYAPFHIAENNVAKKIVELSRVDFDELEVDIDKAIHRIEEKDEIIFGQKQKLAIQESIENGMMIITGGPGTGKTTIINAIIDICENLGMKVLLTAPTGRAAKRMSETTGRESKTIHRLLEYSFMESEDMAFNKNEESPLEADVIIVDEASMIDILLMNSMLKAVNPGTRLILVGDVDQLPSVGAGNVLKDIINSGIIKVVMLDEIFRQAEESMIIVNAHRINKGDKPLLNEKDKDFYFISLRSPQEIVSTIIDLIKERLPNFYGVDPIKDIQVLSPMKKGEVGIFSLNRCIQDALNPKAEGIEEKKIGDEIFRVKDKVMQIKNNYSLEWKIICDGDAIETGEGVFNGDFGYITDIDNEEGTVKVLFDDNKCAEYDSKQIDELKLAYATTVHKAQGSEFPVVVMPIYSGPPMLLTRNLLYTAVTRAKQLVVLVGEVRYMDMMIKNNIITRRYSSLDKKIRNFLNVFYS